MFREQMINFLQTTVVFLLLTNAASVVVAVYAVRIAKALASGHAAPRNATERRIDPAPARRQLNHLSVVIVRASGRSSNHRPLQ